MRNTERLHRIADRFFPLPMFLATLFLLLMLAGLLHLYDVSAYPTLLSVCLIGVMVVYPLYVLELLFHMAARSQYWKQHLLYCVLPPLRLGARDHSSGEKIWLPLAGWQEVNDELVARVTKSFGAPMIAIALLVLPLIAAEFYWSESLTSNPGLSLSMHGTTGLIWLAFALEFIVMISIVQKKVRYCREHWIDIVVILLPLVAFLRVARLARLARLQQTARIYRVRGLAMRAYRAVLLMNTVDHLMQRSPERRLAQLEKRLEEKQNEVALLRKEILQLQVKVGGDAESVRPAA